MARAPARRRLSAEASKVHGKDATDLEKLEEHLNRIEKHLGKIEDHNLEKLERHVGKLEEQLVEEIDSRLGRHSDIDTLSPGAEEKSQGEDAEGARSSEGNGTAKPPRWHHFKDSELEVEFHKLHWLTWACGAIIGLSCTVGLGGCLVCCTCFLNGSLFGDGCFFLPGSLLGYEPLDGDALLERLVRREMRLMLLMPLVALVAAPWTTCEEGLPNWAYALYVPLLVRSKLVEYRLIQLRSKAEDASVWTAWLALSCALGALEHADWFTDAVFPVQAYRCDPDATVKFAGSVQASWAWPLAPIVLALRFWGLLTLVFAAAALSQQMFGSGAKYVFVATAADVSGMGGLAKVLGQGLPGRDSAGLVFNTLLAKVFLENLIQLWLQSSYYGIVFEHLDAGAKAKLLASLCLGLCSAMMKTAQAAKEAVNEKPDVGRVLLLAVVVPSCAVIVWVIAKLIAAHACDSHMWNLTSGCVPIS